jgi:hypothetical protein
MMKKELAAPSVNFHYGIGYDTYFENKWNVKYDPANPRPRRQLLNASPSSPPTTRRFPRLQHPLIHEPLVANILFVTAVAAARRSPGRNIGWGPQRRLPGPGAAFGGY